jgi:large subunit ribosomal protein L24
MKHPQKLHVKIGDSVMIIAGSYKNKIGDIIQINKKNGKIIVKGVNFKFKHIKPVNKSAIGEIRQFETPIHHSNVKLNLKPLS